MTQEDNDEHGPGGMDAIPDDPLDGSEDPGGMSGIPDLEPPDRESHDETD
jgi:hypothetical protein